MRISDRHVTIGRLVAEAPARARVFERWGIDYCCGGNQPLDEVAGARGIDLDQLVKEVEAAGDRGGTGQNWLQVNSLDLIQHILDTHHEYLHAELPQLQQLVHKVLGVHGEAHPELAELSHAYDAVVDELKLHMMKEEQVLFPMIQRIVAGDSGAAVHCGGIANPLRVMRMEHEGVGETLAHIRRITHDYEPPEGACNSYRAMLARLEQLETDLHEHVHKEENILFPRFG
jgi:regulator of cell morphogenesis and NO signaling